MERRDYILTQIQQLGRFLRILIEKIQGKSSSLNLEEDLTNQNQEFKEQCGFDISLLAAPDFEELKDVLIASKSYNSENLELLSDFIVMLADKYSLSSPTLIFRLRNNALQLYEYLEITEKTYSVERQQKIASLRSKLFY